MVPGRDASLVCLSDIYATMAQMLGYKVSDDEAEDSFSFWGNLTRHGRTARKDIIHLSGRGALALREKDSKLIFYAGSGGWAHPTDKELEGLPQMQLYDMAVDPSEKDNLVEQKRYSALVRRLSKKMRKYVDSGRSTPGKPQPYVDNNWEFTTLF